MTEKWCGAHVLQFEEPNILVFRPRGVITDGEAIEIMGEQRLFSKDKDYLLILADITHLKGITPGARRIFAQKSRDEPPRGVALFGGDFRGKVLLDLFLRGVNLLEGGRNQIRMMKDELGARACLKELQQHFTGR